MTVEVKLVGPIFEGKAGPMLDKATSRAIKALADKGEERLAGLSKMRPGGVFKTVAQAGRRNASKGNYRRLNKKAVTELSLRLYNTAIYGAWLEGTSSRNATSEFKGYAIYRRMTQYLQSLVPRIAQRLAADFKRDIKG
jgi:hypothetical protein